MNMINKKQSYCLIASFLLFSNGVLAQQADSTLVSTKSKEEGNRNVMLNASSATGPRQINIGLEGGDVAVQENGLPAVFTSNPHNITTIWRSDASLEHVGLLKISESAVTAGTVGYMMNSEDKLGKDLFEGRMNYSANHFGMQQVDLNLSGSMGHDWFYSGSIYQNFDPGSFKIKYSDFQDRTQIYKAILTKRFNERRGEISLRYRYSNSHKLSTANTNAPFIYHNDGSVSEYDGFKLGTTSYTSADGRMAYRDMLTGEIKETNLNDYSLNKANDVSLLFNYKFDNGNKFFLNAKYTDALGSIVYQTPMGIEETAIVEQSLDRSFFIAGTNGSERFKGKYIQQRTSNLNRGNTNEFFLKSELNGKANTHGWRIGLNELYYKVDYTSNTTTYFQEVTGNPHKLEYMDNNILTTYSELNKNSSEYYDGYENRLSAYITDDWDVTDKLNLYLGLRMEYQRMSVDYLPFDRFSDFYLGATFIDREGQTQTVNKENRTFNWINPVVTANLNYCLTRDFGFNGEFLFTTQRPSLENFAGSVGPDVTICKLPLARLGVFYNNPYINVVSAFTYVKRTGNYTRMGLEKDLEDGMKVTETKGVGYDIQTLGWTTDIVANPFRNFNMHFRFTYQNPKYTKFEYTPFEGTAWQGDKQDYKDNIVKEIPKVLIELDPSYMITKNLRLWASFRYFSKQYANYINSCYFKGHWETFAGINFNVNEHLSLNATVINFLNETGASGSIPGSDLITKEEAKSMPDMLMTGSYLRPLTFEVSASIKF